MRKVLQGNKYEKVLNQYLHGNKLLNKATMLELMVIMLVLQVLKFDNANLLAINMMIKIFDYPHYIGLDGRDLEIMLAGVNAFEELRQVEAIIMLLAAAWVLLCQVLDLTNNSMPWTMRTRECFRRRHCPHAHRHYSQGQGEPLDA